MKIEEGSCNQIVVIIVEKSNIEMFRYAWVSKQRKPIADEMQECIIDKNQEKRTIRMKPKEKKLESNIVYIWLFFFPQFFLFVLSKNFLPQNISIIMFATEYSATAYSCCITGTQMNSTKYATKTANMIY